MSPRILKSDPSEQSVATDDCCKPEETAILQFACRANGLMMCGHCLCFLPVYFVIIIILLYVFFILA